MARCDIVPSPFLRDGAVYWSDNGRRICVRCAGASDLYVGHDISGQKIERVTLDDVRRWPEDLRDLACEMGCTMLSALGGPGGWCSMEGRCEQGPAERRVSHFWLRLRPI